MKRSAIGLLILAFLVLSSTSDAQRRRSRRGASANGINPSCSTPLFPSPTAVSIDRQCGNEGNGGREAAQNTIKNNFCPTTDTAESVTIAKFKELQDSVASNSQINFGPSGPTTDRGPLTDLGEGHLVTLKAFVFIARQEGAESVNCKGVGDTNPLNHDIHISFVESVDNLIKTGDTPAQKGKKECTGIVGELSPHHRPANWTAVNVNKLVAAKALVRITGQQFFDSSHLPCSNGSPVGSNPKRISLWEIHPIYQFEVCTGNCSGEGQWQSLDQWLATH
jgi:hypothetical protein